MINNLARNFLHVLILLLFVGSHAQEKPKFQIGMYALQPVPGTKGHSTGSMDGLEDEIRLAHNPSTSGGNIGVNAVIPYRHWDRVDYSHWDFTSYVITYLEDIYFAAIDSQKSAGIQVLTPPLYSSFLQTPLKTSPENDEGFDRSLDYNLFKIFIEAILEKEISLVLKSTDGNIALAKQILSDPERRPLGGWYLDDEPLVRNHDIEIINSMVSVIRIVEEKFYYKHRSFFSESRNSTFTHPTYAAFDADDLHGYPKSSRPEDGKFYNLNGKNTPFEQNEIYTVFDPRTIDVILPDFYGNNIEFWDKILSDIKNEFNTGDNIAPKVMPVIKGFAAEWEQTPSVREYENLVKRLVDQNVAGIWIYAWRSSIKNRTYSHVLWKKTSLGLGQSLQVID